MPLFQTQALLEKLRRVLPSWPPALLNCGPSQVQTLLAREHIPCPQLASCAQQNFPHHLGCKMIASSYTMCSAISSSDVLDKVPVWGARTGLLIPLQGVRWEGERRDGQGAHVLGENQNKKGTNVWRDSYLK